MNHNDNSEDDDDNSYKQFEIHDGIIFLVEVTPELLLPLKELEYTSQLFEILRSINDLMSELIITMPKTGVGIYMYNCKPSSLMKSMKVPGLTRMFTLNDLNVPNMKILSDSILDDVNGVSTLDSKIIYNEPTDTEQLKMILNKMMDELNRKKQFNNKKLIWFTNNDIPYKNNNTKETLWRIINDFESFNYRIKPMFLDKFKDSNQEQKIPFNMNLYKNIFLNTDYLKGVGDVSEYSSFVFNGLSEKSSLFKSTILSRNINRSILRLKQIRRILFSCDLILGDGDTRGLACSVKGYSLYRVSKAQKFKHIYTKDEYPKVVYLNTILKNQHTNEEITFDHAETDQSITRHNGPQNSPILRRGYELSGDKVIYLDRQKEKFLKNYSFDHDTNQFQSNEPQVERESLTFYDDDSENNKAPSFSHTPYLKLITFKSISTYQSHYNSSPPIFITPDLNNGMRSSFSEGGYSKSFTTFSSLYQGCVELGKYAIVFGCIKRNSLPSLFALYPTRVSGSSKFIKGEQNLPEGFLLIRKPWLDDVRSLPENHNFGYSDVKNQSFLAIKENLKEIIEGIKWDNFNPSDYPSPSLRYFYNTIKHNLLQIEMSTDLQLLEKNDTTALRANELHYQVTHTPKLKKLFNVIREVQLELSSRGSGSSKSQETFEQPDPKRPKSNTALPNQQAIVAAWKEDTLSKFSLNELKNYVRTSEGKIKLATKKQDLIKNIVEYLDGNPKKDE